MPKWVQQTKIFKSFMNSLNPFLQALFHINQGYLWQATTIHFHRLNYLSIHRTVIYSTLLLTLNCTAIYSTTIPYTAQHQTAINWPSLLYTTIPHIKILILLTHSNSIAVLNRVPLASFRRKGAKGAWGIPQKVTFAKYLMTREEEGFTKKIIKERST